MPLVHLGAGVVGRENLDGQIGSAGEKLPGTGTEPEAFQPLLGDERDVGRAAIPVTPAHGTIFVSQVFREPNGVADFYLPTTADERYLIQATTNFVDWVNLSTNLARAVS